MEISTGFCSYPTGRGPHGSCKHLATLFLPQRTSWRCVPLHLKGYLIASTNLDGFNLVNHGWFGKFAKLSSHQTFPLPNFPAIRYLLFINSFPLIMYDQFIWSHQIWLVKNAKVDWKMSNVLAPLSQALLRKVW